MNERKKNSYKYNGNYGDISSCYVYSRVLYRTWIHNKIHPKSFYVFYRTNHLCSV